MNKELQNFVFNSKYARTKEDQTKENWPEAVDRIMAMHDTHLSIRHGVNTKGKVLPYINAITEYYKDQKILGAQRALQWGGDQLLYKHSRMYNCASTYLDRVEFFPHLMFLLLSGAGVGYSAQKHHVAKLPRVLGYNKSLPTRTFEVPDSIEGWADSMKELVESYFYGSEKVNFDFTKVRPKGSFVSGGFKAPGPEPLRICLELVEKILIQATGRKLTTVESSDIACLIADAVISGGVRRAALLAIFSADDSEFMNYKTGDWFTNHLYRSRVNVSAAVLPETPKALYDEIFVKAKEFGEPGIALLKNREFMYNPCFEVGMSPQINGKTGFSFCNLTDIVGKNIEDENDFYLACEAASALGTIQASYFDFPYLGKTTEDIVKRDSLIGVGITGIANNPKILLDPKILRRGAQIVKETNMMIAGYIGITSAARTTVVKPSGNSSAMTGTSSGIHPFHSREYIRNVQVNKIEQAGQVIQKINPKMVEPGFYNPDNDNVVSFPMKHTGDIITKADVTAIQFLDMVAILQENWIVEGTNTEHPSYDENPELTHNVSNTCSVRPDEWDGVKEHIWENRENFCGISLLSSTGDLDYPQAPFTEVKSAEWIVKEYGDAALLAGGLNVDGIRAFGNLWSAIQSATGDGSDLILSKDVIGNELSKALYSAPENTTEFEYILEGVRVDNVNAIIANLEEKYRLKRSWVDRFHRFADKYLSGDKVKTGSCLKYVSILHQWNNLKQIKSVDWSSVEWEQVIKYAGNDIASACSGGKCSIDY